MRPPMLIMILILLVVTFPVFGQFDCQINVNMESISGSVATDQLQNFADDIKNYINSNRWTKEDLGDEKIPCTINIFFAASYGDNRYSAQIFIGSQRPIYVGKNPSQKKTAMTRLFDDKWEFTYLKNQPLYRDENRYNSLTSLLDFYMYLLMGYDFDSYDPLSGTSYFQRAFAICNLAPSSEKGWDRSASTYSKLSFLEELLNAKYQQIREGFYIYHVKGVDLIATKPADAQKNIIGFLQKIGEAKKMVNPKSLIIKTFFDTKYMELADIFKNYQDKNVYQLLASVDPAHQTTYDEARKQ